jgi:hypothetical protein
VPEDSEIYPSWFLSGSATETTTTETETVPVTEVSRLFEALGSGVISKSSAEVPELTTSVLTEAEVTTVKDLTAVVQENILDPLASILSTTDNILEGQGSYTGLNRDSTSTVSPIRVETEKVSPCVCHVTVDTTKLTLSALSEVIMEQYQWPAMIGVVLVMWLVCRVISKQINKLYFRAIFESTKARLSGKKWKFLHLLILTSIFYKKGVCFALKSGFA